MNTTPASLVWQSPTNHALFLLALVGVLSLGCSAADNNSDTNSGPGVGGSSNHSTGGGSGLGGSGGNTALTQPDSGGSAEPCDGFDNNGNGEVDEGCSCTRGTTQPCLIGLPEQANKGICKQGTQACSAGTTEFPKWGACLNSTPPSAETCGDGIDSDCNGEDLPCDGQGGSGGGGTGGAGGASNWDAGSAGAYASGSAGSPGCTPGATQDCYPGPNGTQGVGTCKAGSQTCEANGQWGDCLNAVVPAKDECDNGLDEDCDGKDATCDTVCQNINIFGDCKTVSCPASNPYPVSCQVFFTPGDDRGCVANAPGSSVVYFQAGDECDQGFVTGTLCCSKQQGAPLSQANCPINKPVPMHVSSPDQCPTPH